MDSGHRVAVPGSKIIPPWLVVPGRATRQRTLHTGSKNRLSSKRYAEAHSLWSIEYRYKLHPCIQCARKSENAFATIPRLESHHALFKLHQWRHPTPDLLPEILFLHPLLRSPNPLSFHRYPTHGLGSRPRPRAQPHPPRTYGSYALRARFRKWVAAPGSEYWNCRTVHKFGSSTASWSPDQEPTWRTAVLWWHAQDRRIQDWKRKQAMAERFEPATTLCGTSNKKKRGRGGWLWSRWYAQCWRVRCAHNRTRTNGSWPWSARAIHTVGVGPWILGLGSGHARYGGLAAGLERVGNVAALMRLDSGMEKGTCVAGHALAEGACWAGQWLDVGQKPIARATLDRECLVLFR